jgi:hypothetical protein
MKIKSCVVEQYKKFCSVSASKCNNNEEVNFKIHRAVTLGQVTDIQNGGDTLVVRYYDFDFTVHKNVIVNMQIFREKKTVEIDESVKEKYNQQVKMAANAW